MKPKALCSLHAVKHFDCEECRRTWEATLSQFQEARLEREQLRARADERVQELKAELSASQELLKETERKLEFQISEVVRVTDERNTAWEALRNIEITVVAWANGEWEGMSKKDSAVATVRFTDAVLRELRAALSKGKP